MNKAKVETKAKVKRGKEIKNYVLNSKNKNKGTLCERSQRS